MHELGLARDFFQTIVQKARKHRLGKIDKVVLRVGKGSGIEKDLLRHSLEDHIFPGTMAEGAELVLLDDPVKTVCQDCGREITGEEDFSLRCPHCGSYRVQISTGSELYIENIQGKEKDH